jgi:heat shock protein HtpX
MLLGTEYHEITPETAQSLEEKQLYNTVEEMKIAAGLKYMPKVFIIDADYMNAFASGYSEKSAMVAITRGLMQKLNRDELQAVMAHELSHIRHMDIKLTLTASLLANLMVIVLDLFFYNAIFSNNRNSEDDRGRNGLMIIIIVLRYLLPIINVLLLLYLSRTRELMADAGCVELMRTNEPLARALLKINDDHQEHKDAYNQAYQQTPHENVRREAYIFDPVQAGIESTSSVSDFFSTHPSLETRLQALGYKKKQS